MSVSSLTCFTARAIAITLVCLISANAFAATLGSTPLYFTENKGQWDEHVLYKADGGAGLTWWFERDGLTLAVTVPDTTATQPLVVRGWQDNPNGVSTGEPTLEARKGHALKLRFVPFSSQSSDLVFASKAVTKRTQPAAEVIPDGKLGWNNNYFLGNDSSKWAPDCGNFTKLTYRNVWPGIDVVYYGQGQTLKYDYVVHPGADPADVRLRWLGLDEPLSVTPSSLTASGSEAAKDGGGTELFLATSVGKLREAIPIAYQRDVSGSRVPVEVTMRVLSENEVGLEVTGDWDRSKELVVDPLIYGTYLGGGFGQWMDLGNALAPDGSSGAIMVGSAHTGDFPITEGAYQENFGGGGDVVIVRLSPDGSELIYSTYLGGEAYEIAYAVTAGGDGSVVVAGRTQSSDFPITEDALDGSVSGVDVFIARLSEDGSELIYSTYLGGEGVDVANGIIPDGDDGFVIFGESDGDFPTTNGAYQRNYGGGRNDVFVAKFSSNLNDLIYSTYLGGEDYDWGTAIAPDGEGGVVVAGYAYGGGFPTTNGAFQENFGGGYSDAYVARLSADGSELIYSTYLGGEGVDYAFALMPDGAGGIIVAGQTNGNFPTTAGAYQRNFGGGADAFVANLSHDGSELIFSTYLGGSSGDNAWGIIPDESGGTIITGQTLSSNFPVAGRAIQENYGGGSGDAFITRLNAAGSEIIYSTYLGGDHQDWAFAIAPDDAGGVYVTGRNYSGHFPISEGAFQEEYGGGQTDIFVARLEIGLPFFGWVEFPRTIEVLEGDLVEFSLRGSSSDENADFSITYTSDNLPDSARFTDNGDGTGTFTWQTTYDDAGEYTATFTLSDGERETNREVVIIISNVNRPPVWVELPDQIDGEVGEEIVFEVMATDPDLDRLTISADLTGLPEGGEFSDNGDGTGTFTWRPTLDNVGNFFATFTLSDGETEIEGEVRVNISDVQRVSELQSSIPIHYFLSDPYPNPFNSSTTIRFGLPVGGEVALSVADLTGKPVATLASGNFAAGYHEVVWDGASCAAGVYIIQLETISGRETRKTLLIR